jgi:phosphatidate cytidylyltransferase
MKRVLTAAVLAPLVLLAVFRAPLWLFALLVAAVIFLALHEYLAITEAAGIKPFRWLTYVVSLLPIVAFWIVKVPDFAVLVLAIPVIFGVPLVFRADLRNGLASAAASAFGVLYIGLSLECLIQLRAFPQEQALVIFVLFSVWAGDIAAYYVGRNLGKHKLAPLVSPKKSWEGAIASVVGSVVVAILFFHFRGQIDELFGAPRYSVRATSGFLTVPWPHAIALGTITNVAAQFGDLFESAVKRGAGVKDSGALLPGHGGVLDRIDALLFAIPVVWYYAQIINVFLMASF